MQKLHYNILIATADPQLTRLLNPYLIELGCKVFSANDGVEALYLAEKSNAHMMVLDSEIPKLSAADVAVMSKKIPQLLNLFLVMMHPPEYAFELNGIVDEYINKTVDKKIVVSKLKAVVESLKKTPNPLLPNTKESSDLTVDRDAYMVYYNGNGILLPRKEFELIFLLASRPEKVFTREEIFKHIWHKAITPKEGRTIDVHIRKLRTKISERSIITVKGVGYKIVM